MNYQEIGYNLPPAYFSLIYLHTKLGDICIVECICDIWNKLHHGDTLRILRTDNPEGFITITGKCVDTNAALNICRYLTTFGVGVQHEKTIITETWEV